MERENERLGRDRNSKKEILEKIQEVRERERENYRKSYRLKREQGGERKRKVGKGRTID